jgi:hypothetical protein
MSRHAATRTSRSKSAERAHRAGQVAGTIDLAAPPSPFTTRERLTVTAARNGVALAIVAATIWIYDITRVVHAG